jgi:hypothetical protein
MNLQDLANIGELLGGLAILVLNRPGFSGDFKS